MNKLSFDYDANSGCEVAHYKGLTIRAELDTDASNPWESWEGNCPLIVNYGRDGLREYDKESGHDLLTPFGRGGISDALLRRHMKAICAAFEGFDVYRSFIGGKVASFTDWLASEARDTQAGYGGLLTDIKRDLLSEALEGMNATDRLEALASIYQAIGWQALCITSHGYSQGDYAELLFVATPKFINSMGAPSIKDSAYWQKDMASAAKLYGAWAWGDVYGYVIGTDSDDHLESCWGFYGDDHDNSGLTDAAIDIADFILSNASDKRAAKLKDLIRARVSLALRPELLANASAIGAA